MFTTTLGELAAVAGRRYVRSALLPALVFCVLAAMIHATAEGSVRAALRSWHRAAGETQVLTVAGFLLAVLCVAGVLSTVQTELLRLAEGYWGLRAGTVLTRLGRAHHRWVVTLRDAVVTHDRYPPRTRPEEIMPTRLGNILKAAELYPKLRYGIDAVLVWPRLYPLLPEVFLTTLAAARTAVTALLGSAALAVVLSLGGAGYLWTAGATPGQFLWCLWGGGLVAGFCYRAAVLRAVTYGQHLRVAFDLYRRDLLAALGEPIGDADDERVRWKQLCQFWHRGVLPQHVTTREPDPLPSDEPQAAFRPSLTHLGTAVLTVVGVAGALSLALRGY